MLECIHHPLTFSSRQAFIYFYSSNKSTTASSINTSISYTGCDESIAVAMDGDHRDYTPRLLTAQTMDMSTVLPLPTS